MTQRTASMTFDLPQPFGPTTPVRLLGKLTWVGSTKDLKPASLILVSRICSVFPTLEKNDVVIKRFACEALFFTGASHGYPPGLRGFAMPVSPARSA